MENGLREPEFIGGDIYLRINIYREHDTIDTNRDTIDTNNDTIDTNTTQNLEDQLLEQIQLHPHYTQKQYAELLGVSIATIKRLFEKLQKAKHVERKGTNRSGEWIIKQ
ncbi:winged helix-turn-helix transcriptional regulator [[Clostridium] innocuum]|uniref:winged helix-turn-helix transcriptional regulator n=2 Tax=Bacillota TaxID=1239 RepID=UPI001EE08E12|nr:winged helix-turn-helix transcriptional regulator [[Clostridium] innocuum]